MDSGCRPAGRARPVAARPASRTQDPDPAIGRFTSTIHAVDDAGARARWEALWQRSPQRTAFAKAPYVEAVARAAGLRTEVVLVADAEGDAAGALVCWRRRGPYREVVVPPFTPYSAVLTASAVADADVHARRTALGALLGALEARFHAAALHLAPAFEDARPAQWRGWSARPLYTYRLPLVGAGDGQAGWSNSARRTFRNSRDAFDVAERPDAAAAVSALCAGSYGRHDRPPPLGSETLAALVAAVQSAGLARVFTAARPGAAPDAGVAVVHAASEGYYWIAGSTPGPAMTVLLGELVPRLHAAGLERFDMVGANTPSIAEFKRRLGAVLVPYLRIERVGPPLLRLLRR